MFSFLRNWRRSFIKRKSCPPEWNDILIANVSFYKSFSEEHKKKLLEEIKILLWEKNFVAAKAMQMSEHQKVVISAVTVHLLLKSDPRSFDHLEDLIIYPDTLPPQIPTSPKRLFLSWPEIQRLASK